jgi:hypothetical protein
VRQRGGLRRCAWPNVFALLRFSQTWEPGPIFTYAPLYVRPALRVGLGGRTIQPTERRRTFPTVGAAIAMAVHSAADGSARIAGCTVRISIRGHCIAPLLARVWRFYLLRCLSRHTVLGDQSWTASRIGDERVINDLRRVFRLNAAGFVPGGMARANRLSLVGFFTGCLHWWGASVGRAPRCPSALRDVLARYLGARRAIRRRVFAA